VVLAVETICILVSITPLIAGYIQFNLLGVAIGCIAIGMLWLLSEWRGWAWMAPAGLFVFGSAAGAGVLLGLSPFLMALSVLGSLSAWDLAGFSRRLRSAAAEDRLQSLKKKHLVRLASLGVISLALMMGALLIHLKISFGWMFILALVVILGLMQMVNRYRS
jgi:hypothetical protein